MIANTDNNNYTGYSIGQTIYSPNWRGMSGGEMSLVALLLTPSYIVAMSDGRSVDSMTKKVLRDNFIKICPYNDMLFFSTGQNDFMRENNGDARSTSFVEYIESIRKHIDENPIQTLHYIRNDISDHLKDVIIGIVKFVEMKDGTICPSIARLTIDCKSNKNEQIEHTIFTKNSYTTYFSGNEKATKLGTCVKINVGDCKHDIENFKIGVYNNPNSEAIGLSEVFKKISDAEETMGVIGKPTHCYVLKPHQYQQIYI